MLTNVSIVIPAKNEYNYLLRSLPALKKAIENFNGSVELILVDNGSSDSTVELAESFGFYVIVCSDGPISKLRNIGAKKASGQFIAFLDADCAVDPDWLAICIALLNHGGIGAVGTRAVPDFNNWTWVEKGWYYLVSGAPRQTNPSWLGTSNLIVVKSIFQAVGGFDVNLDTAEDVDLSERIRNFAPLYLEKSINTTHLRESSSLKELFKRELNRGKGSLKHFCKSKNKKKVFISTFFPPAFFTWIFLSLFISIIMNSFWALIIALILPTLFIFKQKAFTLSIKRLCYIYPVSFVYLLARGISTFLNVKCKLR